MGGQGGIPRSAHRYTPKVASALTLIEQILRRGEQVVVFSAFNDPLDTLSGYLRSAGVAHSILDGRVSQKRRGQLADEFKRGARARGAVPVLLAGVECMAEGHNFNLCNNVILLAYSWAFDKFYQAIKRVHRITSPKTVNLYAIICDGSIDRKLEANIQEKGDAAELVLDGRLLGERAEEFNLAQLLEVAEREFDQATGTVDETRLEQEWVGLKARLAEAARVWSGGSPAAIREPIPAPSPTPRLAILPPPFAPPPAAVPTQPRNAWRQLALAFA